MDIGGMYQNIFKCNANYTFNWNGSGLNFSYKNAWSSIRNKGNEDKLAKGIWVSGILKHDIMLWRARWRKVTTNMEIEQRTGIDHTDCWLCGHPFESQSHLFYRCAYATDIWRYLRSQLPEICKPEDIMLDQIMSRAEKRTKNSKCWAFTWSIIAATTWAIWKERNKRKYEEKYTMAAEIARRISSDTKLRTNITRHKRIGTPREEQLIDVWYQ